MDLYQTKEFAQKMYPQTKLDFIFDTECIKEININFSYGAMESEGYVIYNHVKVFVEGQEKGLFPIDRHRELKSTEELVKLLKLTMVY